MSIGQSSYYILKDHLGSWTTVTDAEGNVEQELSFDAWGTLRDPETWTGTSTEAPMFDRGFTGHEHLLFFDLINMNGRMYDPTMSSFLSVDAYVNDPTNAQGFNRYAYCSHNPLRYVDPTGWSNQPFGNPNVAPPCNPHGHTTFYSDDPNDMLWGYGSFSCSSSSGSCNGERVTSTGFREGSNYTVSATGYVTNVGSNGLSYDMLYTEADWNGERCNGLRVDDTSILSQLTVDRSDYGINIWKGDGVSEYKPGHYAETSNIDEAFKVFKYMADNTDVEWEIAGFRTSGPNEYVIATTHDVRSYNNNNVQNIDGSVRSITTLPQYSAINQIFNCHSHHGNNGIKGASGDINYGDIGNIVSLYRQLGSPNVHQWYKVDNNWTIFPKHYVYHTSSHTLYYYTPFEGQSSIYIRSIKSHKDLYRNLGF